jgi:hypothetical protein
MTSALDIALILLVVQGAIGAFDVLYNHEWQARLPSQRTATLELGIHSIRAVLYAALFAGIAWFNWAGAFAWILLLLLTVEVALTLWDFVVEDRTRRLTPLERVVHTVLAMNGGAYVAFLSYEAIVVWAPASTALVPVDRGIVSLILTAYALGVFVSALRDGLASRRLAAA